MIPWIVWDVKKENTAYKEATFRRPLTWWFGKMKRFSQKVSHVETGLLVVWSYVQGSRFDSLEDLFCRKLDERNWSGHILSKNCLAIALVNALRSVLMFSRIFLSKMRRSATLSKARP